MTAAAATLAVATALVKKVLDDLYIRIKEKGVNTLGKARSDVRDVTIARSLSSTTKVKTLWNIDKEVSLYDFYYPANVEFSEHISKRINGIRDFGTVGNFVIQGTAGQGKSIFLRYLCGQELTSSQSSGRVPIFVELRRVRGEFDVPALVLQALEKYKLPATAAAWRSLADSGKFVLLLDAFDEVDPSLEDRTVADIENIVDLHGDHLQLIVTSRPEADIQKSSKFRVLKLAPLGRDDHLPFLKKICADKEQADALMKVLAQSPAEVADLLTTPLMMTLLVILYKSLQTVPDTVPKFYEELFDVLFYRHDHSKPGFRRKRFTQLDDGTVKKLFSAFCFYVRLQGLGVLTSQQMHECCALASKACNQAVDPDKFKNELIKTICLMQEDGFETAFIHKSVAQYYAASFVSKSSDDFIKRFYELVQKQDGWGLELKFLSQIDSYRFHKQHEIPQLLKVAAEVGISLEVGDDSDAARLNDYLCKVLTIVAARPKLDDDDETPDTDEYEKGRRYLGWSANGPGRDPFILPYSGRWMSSVIEAFEASKRPLPPETRLTESHIFISMTKFRQHLPDSATKASSAILAQLRQRYHQATVIVQTEEQKTAMLAAFLK